MSMYHDPAESAQPYRDPTALPDNIPKVSELGVSSAPLKSASFFLGTYCKDYHGACMVILSSSGFYEKRCFCADVEHLEAAGLVGHSSVLGDLEVGTDD